MGEGRGGAAPGPGAGERAEAGPRATRRGLARFGAASGVVSLSAARQVPVTALARPGLPPSGGEAPGRVG